MVGLAVKVTCTSSVEGAQGGLVIVQRKMYTVPGVPVKAVVALVGEVMEPPVPETMLQVPVPDVGVLATIDVVAPQTV